MSVWIIITFLLACFFLEGIKSDAATTEHHPNTSEENSLIFDPNRNDNLDLNKLEQNKLCEYCAKDVNGTGKLTNIHFITRRTDKSLMIAQYIDTPIRFTIAVLGILLNVTLLAIFVREKSFRNDANILLSNILVCNMVILIAYLPMQYYHYYYFDFVYNFMTTYALAYCSLFKATHSLWISTSSLSVIMLSVHRYGELSRILKYSSGDLRVFTRTWRSYLYILLVWLTAFVFATSSFLCSYLITIYAPKSVQTRIYIYFAAAALYISIMFVATVVMKIMTGNLLANSTEDGRIAVEMKQTSNSRMITLITASFWITHTPFFLCLLINISSGNIFHVRLNYTNLRTGIDILTSYLIFLYPCINSIIIYKYSPTCRSILSKFLFRYWHKEVDGQGLRLPSLIVGPESKSVSESHF